MNEKKGPLCERGIRQEINTMETYGDGGNKPRNTSSHFRTIMGISIRLPDHVKTPRIPQGGGRGAIAIQLQLHMREMGNVQEGF